jgi:AcrR family transcriptional regulator
VNTRTTKRAQRREPLTRERVLEAAVKLADQGGIESLSMRKLGQELGVEAMALYYHFASKDEVLDGSVDLVFSEIDQTGRPPCVSGRSRSATSCRATDGRSA